MPAGDSPSWKKPSAREIQLLLAFTRQWTAIQDLAHSSQEDLQRFLLDSKSFKYVWHRVANVLYIWLYQLCSRNRTEIQISILHLGNAFKINTKTLLKASHAWVRGWKQTCTTVGERIFWLTKNQGNSLEHPARANKIYFKNKECKWSTILAGGEEGRNNKLQACVGVCFHTLSFRTDVTKHYFLVCSLCVLCSIFKN